MDRGSAVLMRTRACPVRAKELNAEEALRPSVDIPHLAEAAVGCCAWCRYAAIESEVLGLMTQDPKTISRALSSPFVPKRSERIAGHATNVAEMVIFYFEDKDVRHHNSRRGR